MSIVNNIFKNVLPGLYDNLELQGVTRRSEGMMPNIAGAEMMIGQGGLRNLEAAGMPQSVRSDELPMALADYKELGDTQFASGTDWLGKGVEIDVNADKSMYEIPDDAVRLLKGKDPAKIKNDIGFLELYKADLLQNAYPDIGEIKLRFYDDPKSGTAGSFDPVKNLLTINRQNSYVKATGLKPTILHEVQHFVQAKEGLTLGDSLALRLTEEPDYVMGTEALNKALNSDMVNQDLVKFLQENPKQSFTGVNVVNAIAMLANNPTVDAREVLKTSFGSETMADKFLSKAKGYRALKGILESKELAEDGYRSAFSKYRSTSGEAFANATMVRGDMNQAQINADPQRNEIARQGNDVANLLPSSYQAKAQASQGTQFTDPMASSIQSSIPQGL